MLHLFSFKTPTSWAVMNGKGVKSTINNQFMILLTEEIDKFVNRMLDDIEDIISLNVNIGFSVRECDRM